jgi:hypothetical protein
MMTKGMTFATFMKEGASQIPSSKILYLVSITLKREKRFLDQQQRQEYLRVNCRHLGVTQS